MILFHVRLMVVSRSLKGYGKLGWRYWLAQRRFEHGELPRLPIEGRRWSIVGLNMACTYANDHIGGLRADGQWDSALPITTFTFMLADDTRTINGTPCLSGSHLTTEQLKENLIRSGFTLKVGNLETKLPQETPPPASAGTE